MKPSIHCMALVCVVSSSPGSVIINHLPPLHVFSYLLSVLSLLFSPPHFFVSSLVSLHRLKYYFPSTNILLKPLWRVRILFYNTQVFLNYLGQFSLSLSVSLADLKSTEIHLPPKCWIKGLCIHTCLNLNSSASSG